MTSKISRLNDVRALERIEGNLDVTLAATDGINDLLSEMMSVAANLQDQSLSAEMRTSLIGEFDKLGARIDELTEMASLGGRNLINPDASQISGDLELPDGQVVEAKDLRLNKGRILSIGAVQESLQYTIAFNGSTAVETHNGAAPMPAPTTAGYPPVYGEGPTGSQALNGNGRVQYLLDGPNAATNEITISMSLKQGLHGLNNALQFTNNTDQIEAHFHNQRLFIRHNGVGIQNIATGLDWFRFSMSIDESGSASVYKDGEVFANFMLTNPIGGDDFNPKRIWFEGNGAQDDVSIHSVALSKAEIEQADRWSAIGVQNWSNWRDSGRWDLVGVDLQQSVKSLAAVEASIGGAARTAELKAQIQQRMVDAIDSAAARLVNKDIDRLGSLRAAGAVREQLAQAMMQSQTTTLSAQTSLFSNALGLFDSMNIGGFRPMGLETAGARGGL
ncbi:MAG: hypothetical protein NXI12_14205 [Alphaproteobacteria bacterium]|nr:hypothetical protein [Alphaproteobacteria bacterium]